MGKKSGFFLLEIALALAIISVFWPLIVRSLVYDYQLLHEIRDRLYIIDELSTCCENLRTDPYYTPQLNGLHSILIDQGTLKSAGNWSIGLTTKELSLLSESITVYRINAQWESSGIDRSCELFAILQSRV
jgi:hypothetical protein